MGGHRGKRKSRGRVEEVLAAAAASERALLRAERRAERRLDEVRDKLAKAEARLERRLAEAREAEAALASRQAARAAGPGTHHASSEAVFSVEDAVPITNGEAPVLETPLVTIEPATADQSASAVARPPKTRTRRSKADVS